MKETKEQSVALTQVEWDAVVFCLESVALSAKKHDIKAYETYLKALAKIKTVATPGVFRL